MTDSGFPSFQRISIERLECSVCETMELISLNFSGVFLPTCNKINLQFRKWAIRVDSNIFTLSEGEKANPNKIEEYNLIRC